MTLLTVNPSASNHDAKQATSAMTLTGVVSVAGASQWAGLLLPGVTVPAGATVNSATLYYKATSTAHDTPALVWYAQDVDSAAAFTTTDNNIDTRPRTAAGTSDSATDIGTAAYRAVDVTAQIAAVVGRGGWASGNNIALLGDGQTGVDLWIASWDTGTDVWYVEIDYTANRVTRTIAASADDGLETTDGSMVLATAAIDTDSVGDIAGFLFRSVTVPAGATVTSATLNVYPNDAGRQSPNVTIKGQYNPANFTTTTNDLSGRTMTAASVSWVASNIGAGAYKSSPSLASILNEIVGNAGWASGGNVALFLIQNGASGWFRVASWDHATDPAPQLVIEWSDVPPPVTIELDTLSGAASAVGLAVMPGEVVQTLDTLTAALSGVHLSVATGVTSVLLATLSGGLSAVHLSVVPGAVSLLMDTLSAALSGVHLAVVPGAVSTLLDTLTATLTAVKLPPTSGSFTLDIAAGGDDAHEYSGGVTILTAPSLLLYSGRPYGGLIFRNLAIPAGATVTNAYLNTYVESTLYDSPNLTIRGQADPADFTETAYALSSRTKTAAGVSWVATDFGTGVKSSPDISAVLNEIVGAEGWAEGDDLALFLIYSDAGGAFLFSAYEYATYPPPQLVVEWAFVTSIDVTVPLDTLSALAAAVSMAVTPGGVSQLLDTLSMAVALEAFNVTPGAVAQLLDTLSATGATVPLSVTPGAVSTLLDTLTGTIEAVDLIPLPGGVAILLDTHTATLAAVALSIEGQASYITLDTLSGALSVVPLGVVPGEYVAALNTLIGLLQVMDLTVGQGIYLSTLSAALSAQGLTVAPGEYAAILATLAPTLQAVGLNVLPGAVAIDLDTLSALLQTVELFPTGAGTDATVLLSSLTGALSAVEMGVIPGEMVIDLQTMAATLTLTDLLVYLLLGCALSGVRANGSAVTTDFAALLIRAGDTNGCNR